MKKPTDKYKKLVKEIAEEIKEISGFSELQDVHLKIAVVVIKHMARSFEEGWKKQFIYEPDDFENQLKLKLELVNKGFVTSQEFKSEDLKFSTLEDLILTDLYQELKDRKREKYDKCNNCSKGRLIPSLSGGVHCDRCNYWFCF